ncbi:MAG: hypothetical protein AAF611_11840 [Bacteroidota bacterium]
MNSNLHSTTGNKYVKSLTITHTLLLLGLAGFAGISLFLNADKMNFAFDMQDTMLLVFPIIVISALSMVRIIPQKLIDSAKKEERLIKKLSKYQLAMMIKFILIEGPAMLGIIFFFLTNNAAFVAIAGVLIVFFFSLKPTKEKIESELELRGEERSRFRNGDQVIE